MVGGSDGGGWVCNNARVQLSNQAAGWEWGHNNTLVGVVGAGWGFKKFPFLAHFFKIATPSPSNHPELPQVKDK